MDIFHKFTNIYTNIHIYTSICVSAYGQDLVMIYSSHTLVYWLFFYKKRLIESWSDLAVTFPTSMQKILKWADREVQPPYLSPPITYTQK